MTAAEREKSASPNLLPSRLRTPPRSFSPTRLLRGSGVGSRVFLLLREGKKKNGVGGGEGREASGTAREPASICTRAVPSFPPHPRAERGRGRGGGPGRGSAGFAGSLGLIRAWVAAQAGPAVVVVGRLRGPAEDAAQAAARSARPWGGRLRGLCQPAGRETEDCGGERFLCFGDFFFFLLFWFSSFCFFFFSTQRASQGPPSRVAPKAASRGGDGGLEDAKMALGLACGQGWWRSCSAAAIFPRGAGGARCGSSAYAGIRGAGEPRSQERTAGSGGWSRGRGDPCDHHDPRPKRLARWVGA